MVSGSSLPSLALVSQVFLFLPRISLSSGSCFVFHKYAEANISNVDIEFNESLLGQSGQTSLKISDIPPNILISRRTASHISLWFFALSF